MSNEPRNPEQEYERDLASVRAEWEGMARTEPPDLVDQAVLNAARRDLEAGRRPRRLRWLGGFATATVVVLAVTVVLHQEPGGQVAAPDAVDDLQYKQRAAPPAEADAVERLDRDLLPAAEPQAMKREARRERQPVRSAADATAEMRSEDSTASQVSGLEQAPAAEEAAPDAALFESAAPERAAKAGRAVETEEPLAPETWISQLEALKRSGRRDEFDAGLEAFRRAYPDYPLPPGLEEAQP